METAHAMVEAGGGWLRLVALAPEIPGMDPVSYTHLDVYKRQIRNFQYYTPEQFFQYLAGVHGRDEAERQALLNRCV